MFLFKKYICIYNMFLFDCLFVIFRPSNDFFVISEGLQILTSDRRLRPLSNEGSLACLACSCFDTSVNKVVSEKLCHTYCRAFGIGAVTTYFNDLGLSQQE